MSAVLWTRVDPEDSHYCNEPSNMEDDNENLKLWKKSRRHAIDEDGDSHDKPCQERTLPRLRLVSIFMVQNDQTLQNGTRKNGLDSDGGNPGEAGQPSNE